jgi:hypothetical protein
MQAASFRGRSLQEVVGLGSLPQSESTWCSIWTGYSCWIGSDVGEALAKAMLECSGITQECIPHCASGNHSHSSTHCPKGRCRRWPAQP